MEKQKRGKHKAWKAQSVENKSVESTKRGKQKRGKHKAWKTKAWNEHLLIKSVENRKWWAFVAGAGRELNKVPRQGWRGKADVCKNKVPSFIGRDITI